MMTHMMNKNDYWEGYAKALEEACQDLNKILDGGEAFRVCGEWLKQRAEIARSRSGKVNV